MTTIEYNDQLPIDEETILEWQEQGAERVRWTVPATISELIDLDGLDGFSDWLDDLFGWTVANFSYGIERHPDPDDEYGPDGFLMWIVCDIPETS